MLSNMLRAAASCDAEDADAGKTAAAEDVDDDVAAAEDVDADTDDTWH